MMRGHRELRVWPSAVDLVVRIYAGTGQFPRHEVYGLAGQLQRAAVSVPSNIAEGHAREHINEYLHHLSFAQGSLCEIDTQLEIALRLEYVQQEEALSVAEEIALVGRQLHALRAALRRKVTPTASVSDSTLTPNT
jgi:four helix bundle protein